MSEQSRPIAAPIAYVRSNRARRLRITITPTPQVRVTLPSRVSMDEARRFVAAKQAWIEKHLHRFARQRQQACQMPRPNMSEEDLITAQEALFSRLRAFSEQHKLPYNRAVFRCQKTRWASCSSLNNINLNIHMVFLPHHLQDYILLHELAHIRHKNHSRAFWAELDRLCGCDAKTLAAELRNHTLAIVP